MDFARNLMKKYGWSEGKGLGKTESGISKPIKANLKFDNAGIGHKHGEESNRWWEQLYNECADNVQVEKQLESNDLEFKVKNKDLLDKSKSRLKNKDKTEYGKFIKKSVLTRSKTVAVDEEGSEEEKAEVKIVQLSDAELFAACGGRTAHKGARHGLNLNGKLARIQEQEQSFLKMQNSTSNTPETSTVSNSSWETFSTTSVESQIKTKKSRCAVCLKKRCLCDVFEESSKQKRKIDEEPDVSNSHKQSKRRKMGVSSAECSPVRELSRKKVEKLKSRLKRLINGIKWHRSKYHNFQNRSKQKISKLTQT